MNRYKFTGNVGELFLTEQLSSLLVQENSLEVMAENETEERAKYPVQEKKPKTIIFFPDSQVNSSLWKQKQEDTCKENSTIVKSKSSKGKSMNSFSFSYRTYENCLQTRGLGL